MILQINIILELEGALEIIYSNSLTVQLQDQGWPRSLFKAMQQRELDPPQSTASIKVPGFPHAATHILKLKRIKS